MIAAFANILKIPELRTRVLFTMATIVVIRAGSAITTPGVNAAVLRQWFLDRADAASAGDLAMQMRSVQTFYEPLMEGRYDNLPQRLTDLEQLQQLAVRFEDRATLLAELALDPPDEAAESEASGGDRLVLSTLHSAKGLEWRVVYVLHATDGKIPHERSFDDAEQLEEERRMFYVAMTRAADWLYVCQPRRESSSYGNSWLGNVYEQTTLTRFISKSAKREFQCQSASTFTPPAEAESAPPTPKPRRKTKRSGARN